MLSKRNEIGQSNKRNVIKDKIAILVIKKSKIRKQMAKRTNLIG